MASSVPGPILLPESHYDLSTYMGRVKHCAEISDPRMLFVTKKEVQRAKALIWNYKNGVIKHMTPELWHAKRVLDSTIHPDTGDTVFLPFRMSCCVLSNLVVTAGMLKPGLGNWGTVFWQVANQSVNVAINTSNANKSHPLTTKQLVTSYMMAVGSSCGVALGLNSVIPKLKRLKPQTRLILGRLVPFAAVVAAGIVNVFMMRGEEIRRGISVYDDDGRDLGSSKKAAFEAVGETAASRVINATPIMVIPPLLLVRLQRGFLRGRGLMAETATNLGLIALTSFAVLPFALAVFPQKRTISTDRLEDKFHDLKDKDGNLITKVIFNRGL
ncbi:putative alpha-isopropylmalate carrier [Brettanomyces bruxellensis]|uniref:Sidoreflexin n=1 Tax=Dekkera bruxellensis TaxID=5007 RepID=A0A8H6BR53_DEKBR|nr:Putative alpha-isopropylmalate carrier [Brettanomyces bruxellensis]KAF6006205.1 putative alpha-isopropylmalate carrier [Brettanomyces bruxellensis]KAF6016198.1 putative alpha-isopropylmalate carrier [Brettanomyces bruxellensis]QOU22869.1 Putative alpha-isopropylmalate carrier [Brettanomyces bruxellensis]